MIYRFRKVLNNVYRGSAPALKDVATLVKDYNIKKIVSLDKEDGLKIKNICKNLGIKQIIFPMYGKRSDVLKLLSKDLKELFIDNGPTFIHCSAGKDRTGFVSALLKVKYNNEDPEEAIKEAKELGFGAFLPKEWQKAIKLYEKAILNAKEKDKNDAIDSIVENSRTYIDSNRASPLDKATQQSMAVYEDTTRKYPYDNQYVTTRNDDYSIVVEDKEKLNRVPAVGTYDNNAGIQGVGPVENYGGFLHD